MTDEEIQTLLDPSSLPLSLLDLCPAALLAFLEEALPLYSLRPSFLQLPPIAGGGWPKVWENFGDWLNPIGELGRALAGAFTELMELIWSKIGGAVRWLWNHLTYSLMWLKGALQDVLDWLTGNIWDALRWMTDTTYGLVRAIKTALWDVGEWLRQRVNEARDWLRDRVNDLGSWLWALLAGAGDFLRDNVGGAFLWLWQKVLQARDWLWDRLTYSLSALWNWVDDRAKWLKDRLWDAALWTKDAVLEPILGGLNQIGDWFERGFTYVGDKIADLAGLIGDKIRDAFQWLFEHTLEPFAGFLGRKLDIPGRLLRGDYPTFQGFIDDIMDPPAEVLGNLAVLPLYALVGILSLIVGLMPALSPINERWTQGMSELYPSALLNRMDLSQARWRELPVDIDLWLSRAGYSEPFRAVIAELDKLIPSPADLVTMAVREAFTPDLARELGYVTPTPPAFKEWMRKQGYGEEWSDRYWWAHWRLPSVEQGMEMLHRLRGEYPIEELRTLLKALDIPPLWHDRFVKIAYNPYTRVDVRRMYKMGILREEDVYNTYLDLGYDSEHARNLTEFTKRFAAPDEDGELKEMRDLSAGTIRLGYRRGVLSRDEALDYLTLAGFTEDVADFLLTIDDVQLGIRPDLDADVDVRELTSAVVLRAYRYGIWDRARAQRELEDQGYLPASADLLLQLEDVSLEQKLTDASIDLVKERYVGYDISEGQARSELAAIELSPRFQDLLIEEWKVEQQRGSRKLTTAQVQRAREDALFTDDDALAYLLRLGYNSDDALVLLQIL